MLLVKSVWNYHMLSDEDEVSVAVQLSKLIKDTSPFIRSNEQIGNTWKFTLSLIRFGKKCSLKSRLKFYDLTKINAFVEQTQRKFKVKWNPKECL